jgi:hypothetical protein
MPGATNGIFYTKRTGNIFSICGRFRPVYKALLHWNQLRADDLLAAVETSPFVV